VAALPQKVRAAYFFTEHPMWQGLLIFCLLAHMVVAIAEKQAQTPPDWLLATELIFFVQYMVDMALRFKWGSQALFGIGISITHMFRMCICNLIMCAQRSTCLGFGCITSGSSTGCRVPVLLRAPGDGKTKVHERLVSIDEVWAVLDERVRIRMRTAFNTYPIHADMLFGFTACRRAAVRHHRADGEPSGCAHLSMHARGMDNCF